jgi:hypothetical protein
MVALVKEWRCNEQESFSDHTIIKFRVEKHRGATVKYIHHRIKYVKVRRDIRSSRNILSRKLDKTSHSQDPED